MLHSKTFLILGIATAAGATCGKYVVESSGNEMTFNNYLFQDFRGVAGSAASSAVNSVAASSISTIFSSSTSSAAIATTSTISLPVASPILTPFVSETPDGEVIAAYEATTLDKRDSAMQSYFLSKSISRLWQVSDWSRIKSPVPMQNMPANVFVDYDMTTADPDDTMLSIITTRQNNGIQAVGELASRFLIHYGSIRFEARVTGAAGACAGMFLYADDTDESDFEFLTQEGPDYVHLTNQPGNKNGLPVPGASTNLSLTAPYNEWNTYRLDWTPGLTRYYINDELVVNKTVNVSPLPMSWLMNLWSDGTSWPGVMDIGNSARLDVRWVELIYNNTAAVPSSGNDICRVLDGTNQVVTEV